MSRPRVLFVSGSAGLGHVTRDIAISRELSALDDGAEISWLAGGPAHEVLVEAGEQLLPQAAQYENDTAIAERIGRRHGTVLDYVAAARRMELRNAELCLRVAESGAYDVVVGDETYGLSMYLTARAERLRVPYVMLIDFFGGDATKRTPKELAIAYYFNWSWVRWDRVLFGEGRNRCLFVGDLEDVADRGLGLGLPGRRSHAERYYTFLGSVLPFDPADWADRGKARHQLGYDEHPLIIATIGGTAIGHELLELCALAHPLIRQSLPQARMVLVCGPNVDRASVKGGEGIEVRGLVPDLYRHLAACDVAITQAGGTTTLELTALRRPFVYFPLDGHFEQEQVVAERLARQGAGVRMKREQTTPGRLAATVVAGYGREAAYPPIAVDGARRAAEEILSLTA